MWRTAIQVAAAWCIGAAAYSNVACAQVRNFDIPKGDLTNALEAYSRQAGIQVIYRIDDVRGMKTAGAHGPLDAEAALSAILAGTGFTVSHGNNGAIAIVKASKPANEKGTDSPPSLDRSSGDVRTFDTINVTAKAEGLAAMRVPTELREIPQSVSVISQETLQQQNAYDLPGAFNWATGITVVQSADGQTDTGFYSRGFKIEQIHVDGSAAVPNSSNGLSVDDLSEYDRIEVLRGSDGLFGGAGDPGGTINLVRKQPLATSYANVTATLGSWDYYRLQADATGPLGFDGALRGRVVASATDRRYFYDDANKQHRKIYGTLAYDLGPSTVLTIGGSLERTNSTNMPVGLPRYTTGAAPELPRSTALIFPWDRDRRHGSEAFAKLEHAFSDDWKFKIDTMWAKSRSESADTSLTLAGIDPTTRLMGGTPSAVFQDSPGIQAVSMVATLTGSFDWAGRRQDVMIGMDYARTHYDVDLQAFSVFGPPVNPWLFDPKDYSLAAPSLFSPANYVGANGSIKSVGGYAALRLRPWDGWSVILGARDNYQKTIAAQKVDVDLGPPFGVIPALQKRSVAVSDGVVTPYAGLVYDISKDYSLYLSYADIYKPSSEQALTAAGDVLPPRHGVNIEAGVKAAWYNGSLNGSIALFRIRQDNVPLIDPDYPFSSAAGCCYMAGISTSKGAEAELTGRLTPGWQWSAGYTFNINRTTTAPGETRPLTTIAPKHLLKLWTDYQLPWDGGRWSVGGGLRAQSRTYVVSNSPVLPYLSEQGTYAVATLRAEYRINEHLSAALNVDNLFDRTYYQTISAPAFGNWYGTPRSFMLTLSGTL